MLTDEDKAVLLPKLTNYLAAQKWISISDSDLDAEYSKLTRQEKLTIVNSLINDDQRAKELIKQKLNPPVQAWALQQAKAYIDANSIPIDVVRHLF